MKSAVASYCGKEEYVAGDLTREVASRAKTKAIEFTGKGDYQFGDVTRELNKRRAEWVPSLQPKQVATKAVVMNSSRACVCRTPRRS